MKLEAPRPPPLRVIVSVVLLTAFVVALGATYGHYRDRREHEAWLVFRAAHGCRAVAHTESSTFISRSPSTKGPDVLTTVTRPAQTGWLCDDLKTYFKNDD